MVLYRWRSLETTVKIRLKPEAGGLSPNPENTRELLTPGNINQQELIKHLHIHTETKHHPRANKFQSKTYHANSRAIQKHSPKLQYTGCSKSLQTHWCLITHYWTLHCTPERRNPAPPTKTLTKASLTKKPWQATDTTQPQWGNSVIKRTPQIPRIQKGHHKHSNITKMERQRNTQQVKEQEKCPPNQTKEEEIGSLPEKEFQIIIVKMIQNLEIKMESDK